MLDGWIDGWAGFGWRFKTKEVATVCPVVELLDVSKAKRSLLYIEGKGENKTKEKNGLLTV